MDYKFCKRCNSIKPFYSYGRYLSCNDCLNADKREQYRQNAKEMSIKKRRAQKTLNAKKQKLIYNYLQDKQCVDCGLNDIRVLQFDHINPSNKFKPVSRLVADNRKDEIIMAEIAKCEIVCSNCHLIRTSIQLGWGGAKWIELQ